MAALQEALRAALADPQAVAEARAAIDIQVGSHLDIEGNDGFCWRLRLDTISLLISLYVATMIFCSQLY